MPKEIIQSGDKLLPTVVHVGWTPDCYVQVATLNPRVKPDRPDSPEAGWYTTLDRLAINRLIRVLRRARDAAYGADA